MVESSKRFLFFMILLGACSVIMGSNKKELQVTHTEDLRHLILDAQVVSDFVSEFTMFTLLQLHYLSPFQNSL